MHWQLTLFCVIIALASLFGGSLPSLIRLTHRRIQLTLSFVSGVMLGVALLDLLPHAIYKLQHAETALACCLIGLLFMFFMIRMFHFHQHDLTADNAHEHPTPELCDHDHGHHHVHCDEHGGQVDLSWLGLSFGLAVHTIIDGVALAAAVEATSPVGYSLAGVGVFLAILLHKPLDAMSITSLMSAKGWHPNKQLVVNLVFSLMCPLGAILFAVSVGQMSEWRDVVLGWALAFSAGIFLCISLGDLLPEVHFHSHDRFWLSVMLLMGVLVAFLLELLPGHSHRTQPAVTAPAVQLERFVADVGALDFARNRPRVQAPEGGSESPCQLSASHWAALSAALG